MIQVNNLVKKFDDYVALDHVNMNVKRGNIYGLVGSNGAGKSTLFNKIVGKQVSIIEDMPGVTRDRIYQEATYNRKRFYLIDTGGIDATNMDFNKDIKMQAEIAIEEADTILFVVSGNEGCTADDEYIARMLRKSKKPVILAVNKVDDGHLLDNLMEFKSITASFEERTGSVNLGDFLEELSLVADIEEHKNNDDVVTLMTLHSAKGLEFPYVYLTGMEDGLFPSYMSITADNSEEELEEEIINHIVS